MIAIALKNGILVILLILTVHFLLKRYLLENRTVMYREREIDPILLPPPPPLPLLSTPMEPLSITKSTVNSNNTTMNIIEDEIFNHLFSSDSDSAVNATPPPPPLAPPPPQQPHVGKYCLVGDPAQKIEGFADLNAYDSLDGNYQEI